MRATAKPGKRAFFGPCPWMKKFSKINILVWIHADEMERPGEAEPGEVLESARQELGELRLVHLTRAHRELAMANSAEPTDMPLDWHVVRRVDKDHGGPVVLHQDQVRLLVERAAAIDAMAAEDPQVASPGDRGTGPDRGMHILGILIRYSARPFDQQVDLGHIETGKLQAEIEVQLREFAQLLAEEAVVPGGDLGQAIVGDHEGAGL